MPKPFKTCLATDKLMATVFINMNESDWSNYLGAHWVISQRALYNFALSSALRELNHYVLTEMSEDDWWGYLIDYCCPLPVAEEGE